MPDKAKASGPAAPEADEPFEAPDEYDDELTLDPALDLAFERALKLRRKIPTVTVTSNGTNHRLGKPVLMEPISPAAILNNLLCREELDPSGPQPQPSPTIVGLEKLTDAIAKGEDLTPFKETIERVAANQPEKSDLFTSFTKQADRETLADLYVIRARTMGVIKQASARHDLHLSEAIVVWTKTNEQITEMKKGTGKDEKAIDYAGAVEKIDTNRQKVEHEVRSRWEGTTPQGRELIRKKLWEIKREMEAQKGIFPPGMEPPPPAELPEEEVEPPPLPPITLAHPA